MQYVYVLESEKDKQTYVGCTTDLKKRVKLHNSGSVSSTSKRIPFKLIFYEAFLDKRDAFAREQFLKTGWGKNWIRKNLKNHLAAKNLGG